MKSVVDIGGRSAGGGRLSRSASASGLFFRKQLWIWPVVAAVILVLVALWVRKNVETTIKTTMAGDLKAVLSANVTALEIWIEMQQAAARTITQDPQLEQVAVELANLATQTGGQRALLNSPKEDEFGELLEPALKEHKYTGYVLADKDGRILASGHDELVGKVAPASYRTIFAPVLAGKTVVSRPFLSAIALADSDGDVRVGVPTMFAAAPLRNEREEVVAVLALRIDPELDFTRILSTARIGNSGETYAFDANGLMLSQSRFDDDLKEAGLIPDRKESSSVLTLTLRDPGADLTTGARPTRRRNEQPLTRMVADAVTGKSDFDVDGYRDYRGVPVIGAWTWLPERGFGVATEIDVSEAFEPLYVLRTAFWGLFALLAASAIAIFIFTILMARLQRAARRSAMEARRLGQYSLGEKIGAGGMGVVYKGHHAMLRRPTAIKLLDVDKITDEAVLRFEREVQLTCQLAHPNTIAIYDYGRTPEGVFYYAMEYLDGMSLESLVDHEGPQPEGRVIDILAQVCGSLAEAHEMGLVHRDIKPANILINHRGGQYDFVKVLDFGLVKAVDGSQQSNLTATNSMAGTPLYMSPEAVESSSNVGPASDLYAVGGVGYFLLTGTPVFRGNSIVEICMHQVNDTPELPSKRLGKPVSPDLEALIMSCLAKRPADRPSSARKLGESLSACHSAGTWTAADAERWWRQHTPIAAGDTTVEAEQATEVKGTAATIKFQQAAATQPPN